MLTSSDSSILKCLRKLMIGIGLTELKAHNFFCLVMCTATLAMYLETILSYFVDLSAKGYVR